MRTIIIITGFLCINLFLSAQVQVRLSNTTNFTTQDLIKNIFLGEGVEVLEVKYDGENKSAGYFSNGMNAISIDRGIIMTTGDASQASLPNSNTINSSSSSGTVFKDTELSSAIGSTELNDVSRFEITFKPFYDSVSFRYVFASEEYPAYSCDKYNDVFGFFISGQNPDGGLYDNRNIALIPGTNEVVSINNVHPSYLNNCTSKNVEFYNVNNLGSQTMVYNGYLDVFSASAKVVPCTVYKIKIAIADVVDNLYDSAVFLEARSFSAAGMNVTVETPSYDGVIAEGCQPAKITFRFNSPVKEDINLNLRLLNDFTIGNIASSSVDYNSLPSQGLINKGETGFGFSINAYEDNVSENEEIIAFEYQKDFCNLDTIILRITDNKLAKIDLEDSISICQDNTVNVGAKLPDGYNPDSEKLFQNKKEFLIAGSKGSSVSSTIPVNGINPDRLKLEMLKEVCIDKLYGKNLYDLDIYLVSPDNHFIELSTDNGFRPGGTTSVDSMINTCFKLNAVQNINNGNSVLGHYFPLNPNYQGYFAPEGVWQDIEGVKVNGDWELFIYKDEEGWTNTLGSWHLAFNSNYSLSYNWKPETGISCYDCLSPDIFPADSKYYSINLKDTYGCEENDSIYAGVNNKEIISGIECDSVSTDFIRFSWSSSEINDKFELNINNSGTWLPHDSRFYDITGLGFSEKVFIEVRVEDEDCPNPSLTRQCETFPCPPPEVRTISRKDVDCFGNNNGEIVLEAFGTKGPYTYRFGTIEQTQGSFSSLASGEDTIFVKDGFGCEIPFVFEILSPAPVSVKFIKKDISCYGLNDGEIKTDVFGGSGNYKFKWYEPVSNLVMTSQNISSLTSGKYYLTVVDSNNCLITDSVGIYEPEDLKLIDSIVNIECKGYNNGKVFVDCTGGNPPYSYLWETPVGISTSKNIINVPAGIYRLKITDNQGCSISKNFIITEPSSGFEITYSGNDTLCYGSKNGSIYLNIPDIANYDISWKGGFTGTDLKDLAKGIYSVTVTDKSGCSYSRDIEIVELEPVVLELSQSPASCHDFSDGIAWVNMVFYGARETEKSKFTFKWDTPDSQKGQYAYYLKGGDVYTVTGVNEFSCESKASIAIINPPALITQIKSRRDVSCFGNNDAYIEVEIPGCSGCHFKWSENTKNGDTSIAKNLKSGIYKLTVTDSKGCFSENTYSVTEPPPLDLALKISDVNCYDGTDGEAKINVSGGSPPYFVIWNDTLKKLSIENLASGYHKVEVTDINNCTETDTFFVNQPKSSLTGVAESSDVSCFNGYDGEILFSAEGGSPPYSYRINNREFQGDNTIIGLKNGTYNGTIKDVNGCIFNINNINVYQGIPLKVELGNDTIVDFGTSIRIIPGLLNQSDPVSFQWIVPESVRISCSDCPNPLIEINYNTEVKLIITDSNGCTAEDKLLIRVKLEKDIFVPTAFNPESFHHENSRVFVYGKSGIRIISFIIFDNWGGEVYKRENFEVNDESSGWDGSFKGNKLNAGAYPWKLEILHQDGTSEFLKGTITLLN
jgi:hypothetical protein